jgi:hypothetical protein
MEPQVRPHCRSSVRGLTAVSLLVVAFTVLLVAEWPVASARTHEHATVTYVPITGYSREEGEPCIGIAVRELMRHPNWSFRLDELIWTDVVSDDPDELRASITIDAAGGEWRDGKLAWQRVALTAAEHDAAIAALTAPCAYREQHNNGFSGHYIGVAFGTTAPISAKVNSTSEASEAFVTLTNKVRDRYVASRLADANHMRIRLAGMRDRGEGWQPFTVDLRDRELRVNGDSEGTLDDEDLVATLDWALLLPELGPVRQKTVLTGTLTVNGRTRPIAIDARDPQVIAWPRYRFFELLFRWARRIP